MTPLRLKVRELRLAKGWSQQQLAAAAGVRQGTVSALETGKSKGADFSTLERLALALGADPHALFETVRGRRHPR